MFFSIVKTNLKFFLLINITFYSSVIFPSTALLDTKRVPIKIRICVNMFNFLVRVSASMWKKCRVMKFYFLWIPFGLSADETFITYWLFPEENGGIILIYYGRNQIGKVMFRNFAPLSSWWVCVEMKLLFWRYSFRRVSSVVIYVSTILTAAVWYVVYAGGCAFCYLC